MACHQRAAPLQHCTRWRTCASLHTEAWQRQLSLRCWQRCPESWLQEAPLVADWLRQKWDFLYGRHRAYQKRTLAFTTCHHMYATAITTSPTRRHIHWQPVTSLTIRCMTLLALDPPCWALHITLECLAMRCCIVYYAPLLDHGPIPGQMHSSWSVHHHVLMCSCTSDRYHGKC